MVKRTLLDFLTSVLGISLFVYSYVNFICNLVIIDEEIYLILLVTTRFKRFFTLITTGHILNIF